MVATAPTETVRKRKSGRILVDLPMATFLRQRDVIAFSRGVWTAIGRPNRINITYDAKTGEFVLNGDVRGHYALQTFQRKNIVYFSCTSWFRQVGLDSYHPREIIDFPVQILERDTSFRFNLKQGIIRKMTDSWDEVSLRLENALAQQGWPQSTRNLRGTYNTRSHPLPQVGQEKDKGVVWERQNGNAVAGQPVPQPEVAAPIKVPQTPMGAPNAAVKVRQELTEMAKARLEAAMRIEDQPPVPAPVLAPLPPEIVNLPPPQAPQPQPAVRLRPMVTLSGMAIRIAEHLELREASTLTEDERIAISLLNEVLERFIQ